jgi:hypothetical protein
MTQPSRTQLVAALVATAQEARVACPASPTDTPQNAPRMTPNSSQGRKAVKRGLIATGGFVVRWSGCMDRA